MNILLTGGAGFIGSQLTTKILNNGNNKVTCLDNYDPFYSKALKEHNIKSFLQTDNYRFIEGDICKYEDIEKVGETDVIIHLAAKAGVRPSFKNSALYDKVNVSGTHNLLEYAKKNNIKQFIFASSSSVYGENINRPWKENEELIPISPYASSKIAAEQIGRRYSEQYGIRFIALRFFTVYGPGQRPDLAICKFFKSILNNLPIDIYGDGTTSRDYTFISDILAGIEAAMQYTASDFKIINLGNKTSISLDELIKEIEIICKKTAIRNYLPEQKGDVKHTCADISRAARLLKYEPKTSIKKGLEEYYQWLIDNDCFLRYNYFNPNLTP